MEVKNVTQHETLWAKSEFAPPEILTDNNGNYIDTSYDLSTFDRTDEPIECEGYNDYYEPTPKEWEDFYEMEQEWEESLIGRGLLMSDKYDSDIDVLMANNK